MEWAIRDLIARLLSRRFPYFSYCGPLETRGQYMASPLRNPFYPALLAACATLLITMLVYLMGWMYVPNPDAASGPRAPMPGWMRWIDANALPLIGIEVAVIGALTILMISLDHRFDPPQDHSG